MPVDNLCKAAPECCLMPVLSKQWASTRRTLYMRERWDKSQTAPALTLLTVEFLTLLMGSRSLATPPATSTSTGKTSNCNAPSPVWVEVQRHCKVPEVRSQPEPECSSPLPVNICTVLAF